MGRLEKRTIKIRIGPNPRDIGEIEAEVGLGGTFAVHPRYSHFKKTRRWWTVSHLPTGYSLRTDFRGRKEAVAALEELDRRGMWRVTDADPELVAAKLTAGRAPFILFGTKPPPDFGPLPIQQPLIPEVDMPSALKVAVGNPLLPEYRSALTSSAVQRAEVLEEAMVQANIVAERAYLAGDYETAEAADARAAELAEELESYLEGLDESDNYEERQQEGGYFLQGIGTTDVSLDIDRFPASAEEAVLDTYDNYLLGLGEFQFFVSGAHERQALRDQRLVEKLRYYLDVGLLSAPPGVRDEQLVAAARALWEEREAKRAAYRARRG